MSRLYRWPKKGARFIYKVRHHRGHGIHSPFVFNLINKVIEEKLPYYSYDDLSYYIAQFADGMDYLKIKKFNRLAFRLVNYFAAKNILEIGAGAGLNTLFLTAPSKQICCVTVEKNEELSAFAKKMYSGINRNIEQKNNLEFLSEQSFDCIYIDLDRYNSFSNKELELLVSQCHEKSYMMVKGIRRSKKQNEVWKRLTENEMRTVELDLYHIGLIFFDKQLYRWRYKISF